MMAKLIWQVGLPNISDAGFAMREGLPATEQQRHSITEATETILNWLGRLANSLQEHMPTTTHKSCRTEEKLSVRKGKKLAGFAKYGRQRSTASRNASTKTLARLPSFQ